MFHYTVELARSGQAKCRGCGSGIAKDSPRLGVQQELAEEAKEGMSDAARRASESTKWYHYEPTCVRMLRKSASWWSSNSPDPDTDVTVVNDIVTTEDLKAFFEDVLEAAQSNAAPRALTPAPTVGKAVKKDEIKKKRAKKEDDDLDSAEEEEDTATPPTSEDEDAVQDKVKKPTTSRKRSAPAGTAGDSPKRAKPAPIDVDAYNGGVLPEDQVQQIKEVMTEIKSKTNNVLQASLRANKQKISGRKEDLVIRVAECTVLGALPKCPECKKAVLYYDRHSGEYSCPGSFGDEVKCAFKSFEVERNDWEEPN
ncbi:putative poly [ADP-ribose] polymerase [Gregarina niphandrodes]|uniref:Poly [ADP-ribose] polymerase n=1 Tax=Gregarina niphandrodes TaxID=110365 RepID=A0A023AZP3_GRENI|nr:putative poly [ADP-ribose] polymerase [Gregarina niphandrodes]EZG44352.1 putative poly [ADP-ribose] polymerase [Gregarina niphandrodes]|eukprot:XP_011132699.1 putative poly [ADP-ribose] polymerase [Gregarina niphandrodes]